MDCKRIGILTSGGDCSGLNAIIRSAFIRADVLGYELIGFKRGLQGIVDNSEECLQKFNYYNIDDLLLKSGSILFANTKRIVNKNNNPCTTKELCYAIKDTCKNFGLHGIIFVGGNGSIQCVSNLFNEDKNMPIVVVPKTIDNDVANTEFSVGFFTAIETVSSAIYNIKSTASSHERVMVIEVMGRDAGYIAMYSGVTSGADVILVPEFSYDENVMLDYVKKALKNKGHCIVVVAESVESAECKSEDVQLAEGFVRTKYGKIGEYFAKFFVQHGMDSRAVTLGHVQRGGTTSMIDRIIASAFGFSAINSIVNNEYGIMLAYDGKSIINYNIHEVAKCVSKKISDGDLCVQIAKNLGIYIGHGF